MKRPIKFVLNRIASAVRPVSVRQKQLGFIGTRRVFGNGDQQQTGVPTELFMKGEQGLWYDPEDLTDAKLNWRTNWITFSERFDIASWSKNNTTIVPNAAVGNAGLVLQKLVEDTANANHATTQGIVSPVVGQPYTVSIQVKNAERSFCFFGVNGGGVTYFIQVNLTTGVATAATSSTGASFSTTALADGSWLLTVTVIPTTSASSMLLDIRVSTDGLWANRVYTGDGTSGIYIGGAQINIGAVRLPYQRITDGAALDFLQLFPSHTLFQDATGTTPVTAMEQPIGLALDKRFGGLRGAELATAAYNTPATYDNVTTVQSASAFTATGGTTASRVTIDFPSVSGLPYEVSCLMQSVSTGTVQLFFRAGSAGSGGVLYSSSATTSGGVIRFIVPASFTGVHNLTWVTSANGASFVVTGVTIKSVPGNHASQSTTASRPLQSARVNKSSNLNANPVDTTGMTRDGDAAAVISVVDDTAALAAAGLSSICSSGKVYKFDNSAGTTVATIDAAGTCGNTNPHVPSVYMRATGGGARVQVSNGVGASAYFATADYQRQSFPIAAPASLAQFRIQVTAGTIVWFVLNQLEEALVASSRVQVVTGSTYDATGWPRYFKFDGADDWLQTVSSVDFTASPRVSVFAGMKKGSDATAAAALELGVNTGTAAGTFGIIAPVGASATAAMRSGGTTMGVQSSQTIAAGVNFTFSGLADISTPTVRTRINTVETSNTGSQGTGNFSNAVIYIGRRAGATLPFAGNFYGIVVRGDMTSDYQIGLAERWISNNMNRVGGTV